MKRELIIILWSVHSIMISNNSKCNEYLTDMNVGFADYLNFVIDKQNLIEIFIFNLLQI